MGEEKLGTRIFELNEKEQAVPIEISPASFPQLGMKETEHVERWIRDEPQILGEELLIVGDQYAAWDKTKHRLDLLAIDRHGKVVVVEIKRDEKASGHDLQALRYAAYVSNLKLANLCETLVKFRTKYYRESLSEDQAERTIREFINDDERSPEEIDDDPMPRIILVATGFQVGVTATALWLRTVTDLDISCVQITPYQIDRKTILSSTILIPLPDEEEFKVSANKPTTSSKAATVSTLDLTKARYFVERIPTGKWASYGDVATFAGSSKGGMGVASWLMNSKDVPSTVYRILKSSGEVSPGWVADDEDLPKTVDEVRERLISEGVGFNLNTDRASQEDRWISSGWPEYP